MVLCTYMGGSKYYMHSSNLQCNMVFLCYKDPAYLGLGGIGAHDPKLQTFTNVCRDDTNAQTTPPEGISKGG
jgi:hypothetical protein